MPQPLFCQADGAPLERASAPALGELVICPNCGAAAPASDGSARGSGLFAAYLGPAFVRSLRTRMGLAEAAA